MMTRRPAIPLYVVVRFDPGADEPQRRYSAVEVVRGAELARAEAERLGHLEGEQGIQYFVQRSQLYVPERVAQTIAAVTGSGPIVKDASIDELLSRLASRFDPAAYEVIDHWPSDPYAIGIAAPQASTRFVYLSTLELPRGRYNVHLERAPDPRTGSPYEDNGYHAGIDFDRLSALLARYLDLRPAASTVEAPRQGSARSLEAHVDTRK
ncbi:MAG TPA: hypothetical protein VFY16_05420 [Gemmatimonadaceae bacterium]|nr:hypothetical protein [Gemmatimonadaceae bacterium]